MKLPDFGYEKRIWKKGYRIVAGVDEVGRGCFAGPVVAAAVVFAPISNENGEEIIIDDSKKLTKLQRERACEWIKKNATTWGIGEVSAKVINSLGMGKATQIAFRRAVANAGRRLEARSGNSIQFLLVDAFYIPFLRGFPKGENKLKGHKNPSIKVKSAKQLAIVNGDEKSVSIAAASIIAKVYRDSLMEKIGSRARYKKYDWVSNKGYATKHHRNAILKYGITGYHRKQFVETFLGRRNLS